MIVRFEGKTFECYRHTLNRVSYIKLGDFVTYNGELCKVVTIQRNCEPITRGAHPFTMVTLKSRDGNVYPARDLYGKIAVFRGRVVK